MSRGSENPFGDNPCGGTPQYGGGMAPMPMAPSEGDATGGVIP